MLAIVQPARANPCRHLPGLRAARLLSLPSCRSAARSWQVARRPGPRLGCCPGGAGCCLGCGFAGVLTDGRLRGTAGSGLALFPG